MTRAEYEQQLVDKRNMALSKAQDTTLPARYRENFAVRAEVYQEILDDLAEVDA